MGLLRRCKDCAYFQKNITDTSYGECRRKPPVIFESNKRGVWPLVAEGDYCGEWIFFHAQTGSYSTYLEETL